MRNFMIFGVPAALGWWHMEPSRRIFSEHIKDPELALCTNYTSTGSPAANESHIQFYLKDFEKILIMHSNCLSGSPHGSGQFTLQGYYFQMCGGAVNRQPGYRARNLQSRGA